MTYRQFVQADAPAHGRTQIDAMTKHLPLLLFAIAAGIYLAPIRQQAVLFNLCVESKDAY